MSCYPTQEFGRSGLPRRHTEATARGRPAGHVLGRQEGRSSGQRTGFCHLPSLLLWTLNEGSGGKARPRDSSCPQGRQFKTHRLCQRLVGCPLPAIGGKMGDVYSRRPCPRGIRSKTPAGAKSSRWKLDRQKQDTVSLEKEALYVTETAEYQRRKGS